MHVSGKDDISPALEMVQHTEHPKVGIIFLKDE
jgi:hypothetical protein